MVRKVKEAKNDKFPTIFKMLNNINACRELVKYNSYTYTIYIFLFGRFSNKPFKTLANVRNVDLTHYVDIFITNINTVFVTILLYHLYIYVSFCNTLK